MATIVLSTVGAAIGGAVGGPIGAAIGRAAGAAAGYLIDQELFGPGDQQREGPRLSDVNFQASTEGAAISRVWGKMRVSPQVIWATRFTETKTTTSSGGGKGGGGTPKTSTTEYFYSVSFASGLCEGEIIGIGRAWADGKPVNLGDYTYRLYTGSETQGVDPKILAIEGADNAPAFRGTAYVVFEDMALEKFANRVPQMTFEVLRRPLTSGTALEDMARAMTLLPGATEFGYATTQVSVETGFGDSTSDNSHAKGNVTDLVVALDDLQAQTPGVTGVTLVVAWHGTDLRCGDCEIRPKVENASRTTKPFSWQVGPVTRSSALVVSQFEGKPAAGGAPSDRSVYEVIKELSNRGLKVTLYPFILMDIAAGNGLPDPYGASEQASYPWRGRITCHPAPGEVGSPDKTSAAATQVQAFFGTASASDFGWDAGNQVVTYSGANEWGLRRQVLHLAEIAKAAGGVDQVVIGSELIGLTTVRSAASTYPAVSELVSLAAEMRTLVGSGIRIGYAANWSEYHSHRPSDGSGDVYFNLDLLWADTNIDFIGIDNYLPMSDWRDGTTHLDAVAGYKSIYSKTYLQANVEGGEYFDWYYASQADRDSQTRTNITDGSGKPWVFANKDIRNWWLNSHYDRPGGVEAGSPTAWTPQSKPIVFTELGCPAVDKGSNQPNVFVDPKSSESAYPHYSDGRRDDGMQKACLEAILDYWNPANGNNPTSSVYSAPMIDWDRIALWTWDARPYPEFPNLEDVWSDAPNWKLGHWLSGRLNLVWLRDVVAEIANGLGVSVDSSELYGLVYGYLADQVMSARGELSPLTRAYFFDAVESGSTIFFRHRGSTTPVTYSKDDLVKANNDSRSGAFKLTRAQESELPRGINVNYYSPEAGYRQVSASSRRLIGNFQAIADETLPLALPEGRGNAIADGLIIEAHVGRERAGFVLPPSALALEPGDAVLLDTGTRTMRTRLLEIGVGAGREVSALREDPNAYDLYDAPAIVRPVARPRAPAQAEVYFLDLPLFSAEQEATAHAPRIAAYGLPWAPVAVYRAADATSALNLDTIISSDAIMGVTTQVFNSGTLWLFDQVNKLTVQIGSGDTLASASEIDVLNGANAAAVQTPSGNWEIIQFINATLVATNTYELTMLLRGQLGTDTDMATTIAAGAAFVMLDDAVVSTSLPASLARAEQYWSWGPHGWPTGDAVYQSDTKTFQAIGLRPYAPAHFTGDRDATGDVALGWIRRTRIGGDDWELVEVPLSEDSEAYEVDILNGSTVVRTFSVSTPAATYTAADQTTDFGSAQASFDAIVYQLSATYGRGAGTKETL